MSISIVLRTDGSRNIFRDAIISALGSKCLDEALLCSGFFQDNFKKSAYKVSDERSLARVCAASGIALTTVGIHNSTWKPAYKNFRDNMNAAGVSIKCMYKNGMRWHAKVFIGSKNGNPIFGIVGSSNMTRNAFSTGAKFNNECDVFIWDRRSPIASLGDMIAERLGDQIVIRAPYVPRMNDGLSVSQTLGRIQSEVLGSDLQELI
ncbi:phospholipase D family protein [Acetobacter indonesiensis]|uniref:phospholipase D family protein n=1 Tax=Acetobacter indonesiensis TaxID=104101 RepID=UPI0039E76A30